MRLLLLLCLCILGSIMVGSQIANWKIEKADSTKPIVSPKRLLELLWSKYMFSRFLWQTLWRMYHLRTIAIFLVPFGVLLSVYSFYSFCLMLDKVSKY